MFNPTNMIPIFFVARLRAILIEMRIDGKAIADTILSELAERVAALKKHAITPTLAVIQVGDDPASTAYINQKKKAAERIGAVLLHEKLSAESTYQRVNMVIREHNADPKIHGIIVQQPLPLLGTESDSEHILNAVDAKKDVDGFLSISPYEVPVAMAVQKILEEIFHHSSFMIHNSIVVIGRGATAGKPIADVLISRGSNVTVVHSQTQNPDTVIKTADIVISCVGKQNIVRRDNVKRGVILISVGIWRDENGKLHGDYEEDAIKNIAGSYTPTPGGVGPVNVACLMANLVKTVSNAQ